jgi:hypothetical protein
MEKETNVIQFPFKGNHVDKIDTKTVQSGINLIKYHHVEETMAHVIPQLFNNIDLAGFNVIPEYEDEGAGEFIKDCSLLLESLRSLLYKHHGIKHPFQTVAENVFIQESEMVLKIVEELNIKLEPEVEPEGLFEEDSES